MSQGWGVLLLVLLLLLLRERCNAHRRPARRLERVPASSPPLPSARPLSAVGVLRWWLRHRSALKPPESGAGDAEEEADDRAELQRRLITSAPADTRWAGASAWGRGMPVA